MHKINIGFALVFWLAFYACTKSSSQTTQKQPTKYLEYELLVIDECEYLVYGRNPPRGALPDGTFYNTHTLTHKGNCKNPIHQCK